MRVSQFYLSTLKEAPAEADVVSQQLMLRAGLIKKLGAGIYTWMPLGLRTLRKVEAGRARGDESRRRARDRYMPHVAARRAVAGDGPLGQVRPACC